MRSDRHADPRADVRGLNAASSSLLCNNVHFLSAAPPPGPASHVVKYPAVRRGHGQVPSSRVSEAQTQSKQHATPRSVTHPQCWVLPARLRLHRVVGQRLVEVQRLGVLQQLDAVPPRAGVLGFCSTHGTHQVMLLLRDP